MMRTQPGSFQLCLSLLFLLAHSLKVSLKISRTAWGSSWSFLSVHTALPLCMVF